MANTTIGLNESSCNGEDGYDSSKSFAIILSILLSLIVLPSLYGIIWFERFGTDSKRTLLNQLIASICWCLIISIICLQFPMTIRFILKKALDQNICALIDFAAATIYNLVLGMIAPVICGMWLNITFLNIKFLFLFIIFNFLCYPILVHFLSKTYTCHNVLIIYHK